MSFDLLFFIHQKICLKDREGKPLYGEQRAVNAVRAEIYFYSKISYICITKINNF